jgi:hypothetical protein
MNREKLFSRKQRCPSRASVLQIIPQKKGFALHSTQKLSLFIELSEVPIPRKCERIGNGESVGFVTDRTVTCRPKIGLIYSPSTHSQVA